MIGGNNGAEALKNEENRVATVTKADKGGMMRYSVVMIL